MVKIILEVLEVGLREFVVVDEEFLNIVECVVSVILFLGDLRKKPLMQ